MNDDTIRTRAINYTRGHWRTVLHGASWALAAIVTISVSTGTRRAHSDDDSALVKSTLANVVVRLDGMASDLTAIRIEQASEKMANKDRDDRQDRMEDNWDNAFQHAGDRPRPLKRH